MTILRRHPLEVTADRLAEAVENWHDEFTPGERDDISRIRNRLEMIALRGVSKSTADSERGQE